MSLKIVKDSYGHVIAYGPNDDNYVPSIPAGGALEIGNFAELWINPETLILAQLQACDAPFKPRLQRETLKRELEFKAAQLAELAKIVASQLANPLAPVDLGGMVKVMVGDPSATTTALASMSYANILAANPAYTQVKAFDDAAAAARAQLTPPLP